MKPLHYWLAKWDQWRINVRVYDRARLDGTWVLWDGEKPSFWRTRPVDLRGQDIPAAFRDL